MSVRWSFAASVVFCLTPLFVGCDDNGVDNGPVDINETEAGGVYESEDDPSYASGLDDDDLDVKDSPIVDDDPKVASDPDVDPDPALVTEPDD